MQDFSISPREMGASFWRNRSLIYALSKREVIGRYRGSYFGILWSFFNPVLMLVVYTFVFGVIFKSKWSDAESSRGEFALLLFSGLIAFNFFAECITRAPDLIISNINYVKKVVFPLEILSWVILLSALFQAFIGLLVWFVAYLYFFGLPHATSLYLPIVIFPLCFFSLGLSWALASLGVFLRDISQFVVISTSVLMFLSPIFYPVTALPEGYRQLFFLNPLTTIIEQMREVLFWGNLPDFFAIGLLSICSLIIAWFGYIWFQKTRKGFADVL